MKYSPECLKSIQSTSSCEDSGNDISISPLPPEAQDLFEQLWKRKYGETSSGEYILDWFDYRNENIRFLGECHELQNPPEGSKYSVKNIGNLIEYLEKVGLIVKKTNKDGQNYLALTTMGLEYAQK